MSTEIEIDRSNVIEFRQGERKFWSEFLDKRIATDNMGRRGEEWQPYLLTPPEMDQLKREEQRLVWLNEPAKVEQIRAFIRFDEEAEEIAAYGFPLMVVEAAIYDTRQPNGDAAFPDDIVRRAGELMEGVRIMYNRMTKLVELYTREYGDDNGAYPEPA